jgi:uncharacterized protein YdhG (YjbR/CyaY superfamily)
MSVIDDLLEKTEPPERIELERIRRFVHAVCPECMEIQTYGMPGFKYKGKYLLSFGAFEDHMSLFPGAEPIELLKAKLQSYHLSKGTIQFTLEDPLPDDLLTEIIELCKARIDTKATTGY